MLETYQHVLQAATALGGLMLVQLLVADVAGISVKHSPGTPVDANPGNFLFRASRTLANTNESVAIFILLAVGAVAAGADPTWLARMCWLFVFGRVAHMTCYYADWRLARSVSFVFIVVALLAMLVLATASWL